LVSLLIFFLFLLEIFGLKHEKTRWRRSPAGLGISLDLSGRLVQATTVRRHGVPMMMVMTVMAVALHLFQS
jgi:hypothetical protein